MLWHFQGVHHDIWDRDFPSPPALVTVKHEGKTVDGVAQTTKQGFVFVFDRVSGKPLFPIEERPFPASNVPGEVASRTQPVPLAPAALRSPTSNRRHTHHSNSGSACLGR
jgi:quinoprotein glucose dehydrogenase